MRGFSAWQTGVAIFSTGAASLAGVPVYMMLAKRFDTRWLMIADRETVMGTATPINRTTIHQRRALSRGAVMA